MSSVKAFLLPLYYIKKQARTRFLNEKSLTFLITFASLLSLIFIFKNLPSKSLLDDQQSLNRNVGVQLIHNNNDPNHQRFHQKNEPKFQNFEKSFLDEERIFEDDRVDKSIKKSDLLEKLKKDFDLAKEVKKTPDELIDNIKISEDLEKNIDTSKEVKKIPDEMIDNVNIKSSVGDPAYERREFVKKVYSVYILILY
jgi:hypothetical protein